jgi:phage shock protein C
MVTMVPPEARDRCKHTEPKVHDGRWKGGDVMTDTHTRTLYRSRTNRQIAGVCGGLAEYFHLDATLIRVLFAVLAVFGGSGLLLYLVLWLVVPEEPQYG